MREQPMATGDVHDTTSAEETPDTPRGLPALEELLARETSCVAHSTRQPMEKRVVRKAAEIVVGQPSARGERERHAFSGLYQLEEYRSQRGPTAISRPRQRSGRL